MSAAARLAALRRAGLARRLRPSRARGARVRVGGRSLINLCSNDYLGMDPRIGAGPTGQMQSSSRLLSGSDERLHALEGALARHKSRGAALAFPSGYMANIGALATLAGPGDLVLSDELNHASIIDACRLSGARVSVYGHLDASDLDRRARARARRRVIVTEGTFSMDGDSPDMGEVSEVASRRGAEVVVDDAHGDFALGEGGRGTPGSGAADVYTSSLSKALGSFGGYVAARRDAADLMVSSARAFIYTSALPGHVAAHARARLLHRSRAARQARLRSNALEMARRLSGAGLEVPPGAPHIVPVRVGPERGALRLAGMIERRGVFAQAVRYPTVARGEARIRLSVTAWLSRADVAAAADAVAGACRRAGLA